MMATERIGDLPHVSGWSARPPKKCFHKEHDPDLRGLAPGEYRHTCPACGERWYFTVHRSDN